MLSDKLTSAGIRIFCTEERSQMKNRERAMQILKAKLFDIELQKQQAEIRERRQGQVLPSDGRHSAYDRP